ncbi:diphosphate--fructose-6-phosphate 1-phosphotransferase [Clostridium sp. MCC353]|uniref:6-phosphofructokinase n=1 Tax=Clostridium sp. MCC353 TaxID=2592646 RepID=UPI001C01A079|nr:6-phosphofructokinase [Clostridium sp. MCC353]MBT9779944.1 diphosphate--fructose-6-phosphate 1-phosphotransferase [Clostridium sp. MCC353]
MNEIRGNVIVGQSGGPTAVINSSLAGVYKTARDRGAKKVFGMLHGIQGLLEERVIDLSAHITSDLDIDLLKRTPSAYLGSCRYKLPEIKDDTAIYDKIFAILDKLEIEYFFYIGGNDSMDTIKKLSDYSILNGSRIRFMGVPKTIDNDLAATDHTPGFGSAAKYIASITKEVIRDGLVYDQQNVTLLEIMGRNAGWLTGAAALAKGEDCEGPDLIFLPEVVFDVDQFMKKISDLHKVKKSVVVAISEGVKLADGRYVCEMREGIDYVDAFGHRQLTGTARYLSEKISREVGCKTRAIEFNSLQRCASHIVSRVDITEAFQVGGAAVKAAFEGETGKMIILKRVSDDPYICVTDIYDVHKVANVEKKVPDEWINETGDYVTPEFVNYVRPLIQAELTPMMVDGLPRHLYYTDKEK